MAHRSVIVVPTLFITMLLILPVGTMDNAMAADGESRGGSWEWDRYHMWNEVEPELRNLTQEYSDIAVLYDLGELYPHENGTRKTTWEGRTFWGVKVSDNPHLNESEEPKVLYVGMHHSREWMTTEMLFYLLRNILEGYGNNATLTDLVDNRELWFFPILNPDGFVYSETERMWRKNRRDNGDGTIGVDPNRNYGYEWGYDDIGSKPDTDEETYRGPAPFSEPCTQVMRDMALDLRFAGAISFHTWQDVILFPVAYKRIHAPHYAIMKELARQMAEYNGYEYGDVADGILYTVNGGWDDFMYYNASTICFTFEMNSAADGRFDPPPSLILETVQENYEPALLLATYADDWYRMWDGGIEATVMDPRGNPMENATVHVDLLADEGLDFVTGPDGSFSFHAPNDLFYAISVEKEGYTSWSDSVQVRWRDRMTQVNITIKDNVPPRISRVEASHQGEVGTDFGIGQEVRIDVYEEVGERDLEGIVTIQSVPAQYFNRRKALTYDGTTDSYYYLWDTTNLKPRNDYLVTTELWDIDDNKDKDGVIIGEPDLTITLRDITPPMVPINLSVDAPPEGGSLVLVWEANTDDTETYTLERKVGLAGEWAPLINLTDGETTFTDQGLENGVLYTYRVMAWDKVPLPSGWSVAVTGNPRDLIPPGEVLGLAVSAPSHGGVLEISWQESTDDTATYVLYRDPGTGPEEVGTFARGVTQYTDTDVVNDRTYRYSISSFDAAGNEGPRSLAVLGAPRDAVPPPLPQVDRLPELTNISEHQVTGTAEAGSTVIVMVNQVEAARFDVAPDGTFEGTVEFEDGINRVTFKSVDASFNPSGHTEAVLVQVDLNAPRVTYTEPVTGAQGIPIEVIVNFGISEELVTESVTAAMTDMKTGERVTIASAYAKNVKIVTVAASTPLKKGTDYRIVVEGTDVAGNHLTGGELTFTTVKAEEPEPAVGGSMVMLLLIAVICIIVVVVVFVRMSGGKEPPREFVETPPAPEPQPPVPLEGPPSYPQEYDPSPPTSDAPPEHGGWDEY